MKISQKKIVITGAGGYVGSDLLSTLADEYYVVGFGHPENFASLADVVPQAVMFVPGDVRDADALAACATDAFAVVHTASPTKDSYCQEHPWEALTSIVHGTRAVGAAVRKKNIPLFIHFSTQNIYTNFTSRPLPFTEDMEPMPDTLYGALKAEAEREATAAGAIIVRPANIYGKNNVGIDRINVVSRFVNAVKMGSPLIIHGTGEQRADYVHIRDVGAAVRAILADCHSNAHTRVYNISIGACYSVREIADCVLQVARERGLSTPLVTHVPVEGGRIPADRMLLCERLRELLPSFPSVTFDNAIREMMI